MANRWAENITPHEKRFFCRAVDVQLAILPYFSFSFSMSTTPPNLAFLHLPHRPFVLLLSSSLGLFIMQIAAGLDHLIKL